MTERQAAPHRSTVHRATARPDPPRGPVLEIVPTPQRARPSAEGAEVVLHGPRRPTKKEA